MLKLFLNEIKENWYDNLYYENKKVTFNHFEDYNDWLNKIKMDDRKNDVYLYIKNNKLDKIINSALKDDKIKSKSGVLCIYCLISKIKIIFDKDCLEIYTILSLNQGSKRCNTTFLNEKENVIIKDLIENNIGFIKLNKNCIYEGYNNFGEIKYKCQCIEIDK